MFKQIEKIEDYKNTIFYSQDASRISSKLAELEQRLDELRICLSGLPFAITKQLELDPIKLAHTKKEIPGIRRELWYVVFYNEKRVAERDDE